MMAVVGLTRNERTFERRVITASVIPIPRSASSLAAMDRSGNTARCADGSRPSPVAAAELGADVIGRAGGDGSAPRRVYHVAPFSPAIIRIPATIAAIVRVRGRDLADTTGAVPLARAAWSTVRSS